MNPSLKMLMCLIFALELSIKPDLIMSIIVIIGCLLYLLIKKTKPKSILFLLISPILAAIVAFVTIYYFSPGHNLTYAFILFTRIYVYVLTTACVFKTVSIANLVRSFEQNLHLPSKFAYGILAAFNILPRMFQAVKRIQTAAMMRNVHLHIWSARLYFKAILVALASAENLAQGMQAHGYDETKKRSVIKIISITKKDWLIFASGLILYNLLLFYL